MSRFHLFGTYSRADTFVPRMVSAAVLAPLAVLAAWRGGPVLAGLAAVASVLMGWEWGRLTEGRFGRGAWLVVAVELAGVGLAAFGRLEVGLGILTLGAVARLAWTPGAIGANLWAGAGTLWIGAGCVSLLWLASDPTSGRATVLWLFALVWVTDSAAYLVGRSVGGPRLAPRWSPRKTWSGAVGGIAAAGIVGAISAKTLGISMLSPLSWVSMGLSVAAQFGDLLESAAKRRFGAKDTSGLIPGHGGLLDRLDGMLAALVATALLALITGASPIVWS